MDEIGIEQEAEQPRVFMRAVLRAWIRPVQQGSNPDKVWGRAGYS
jgi:hypothetical protein